MHEMFWFRMGYGNGTKTPGIVRTKGDLLILKGLGWAAVLVAGGGFEPPTFGL